LDSIFGQSIGPAEVVVVDNASSDGTADLVESHFSQVRVLRNGHNAGYGAAVNLGASACSQEFLAVVNPDAFLDPHWALEILKIMKSRPRCGAAEGKLLLARSPQLLNCRGSLVNLLGFGCPTGYNQPDQQEDVVREVAYPSGAAFVARRNAFDSIGGFDEHYFLYHEDVDFGLRMLRHGWPVVYVPTAIAYHDYEPKMNPWKLMLLERNRWRTLVKNMPSWYFVRCAPLMTVCEVGIWLYLTRTGMVGAKARATLEFLRSLPEMMTNRAILRENRWFLVDFAHALTDEFPRTAGIAGWPLTAAWRLQRGYMRAFFS